MFVTHIVLHTIVYDFVVYKKNELKIASQKCLNLNDEEFSKVSKEWSEGIFRIFDSFPRFDWEN